MFKKPKHLQLKVHSGGIVVLNMFLQVCLYWVSMAEFWSLLLSGQLYGT